MKKLLFIASLAFATPAFAADYAPPSQELWAQMTTALQGVSMPLAAHQAVGNILTMVQQQAVTEQVAKTRGSNVSPSQTEGHKN